ncbi:MAG: M16 family metallopeptidase [Bacteroidales bacterium]
MKKIIISLLLLFIFVSIDAQINPNIKPDPTEAKAIKIGEFKSFTAENNMKVFLIRRAGYPKFRITIDFGIPMIPVEKQPEIKYILSDIFSIGNGKYTKSQITDITDYYASYVSCSVNNATCSGMKEMVDTLLPLMSSFVTNLQINDSIINLLKEKRIKEFKEKKNNSGKNPKSTFSARLQDSLQFYKEIPYPKIEESLERYSSITADSVRGYFSKYINPENSYCIITGDFTVKEVNELIKKYFKGWKSGVKYTGDYKSSYEKNFPEKTRIYVIDNPLAVQSKISVRWPLGDAFPYGDNEPLLMIMNQIYGAGYLSNLNRNIRLDKGLSYGANNFLVINVTGGYCSSNTLVRNTETAYALENIFFEMFKMRNELVSQSSLEMAKNGLLGDYARSMSQLNSPAIIGFCMVKDKFILPDDYLATYPLKLSKVTAEEIRNGAQKYIRPFESVVIIEGKVDDIKGTLEKFGPVEYYSSEGKPIL